MARKTTNDMDEGTSMTKAEQYLIEYINAWTINELANPTQEILDEEIKEILAGEHSADCKLTIDKFKAENK